MALLKARKTEVRSARFSYMLYVEQYVAPIKKRSKIVKRDEYNEMDERNKMLLSSFLIRNHPH